MTEPTTATQTRRPGIPIGRPLGIPVYLAPSWVVISVFVAIASAESVARQVGHYTGPTLGDWATGITMALLLAVSVLAHELGHSALSLLLGLRIHRITLFLFGGYAQIEREPDTPRAEYLIAIAGPLVSLILAGVASVVALTVDVANSVYYVANYLAATNFILAVLNLLPGLPLDGGRVLRAAVWHRTGDRLRATKVSVRGGQAIAVLVGGFGITSLFAGNGGGLLTIFIGLFLWTNATALGRQADFASRLPLLRARALARPALPVPAGLPLAEALRRGSAAKSWLVTVDSYGRPSGLVSEAAVHAVPNARRPWVTVGEVCRSLAPELVLPADLAGEAIIEAMGRTPASEYLVIEPNGTVVGVLAARDVAKQMNLRDRVAELPA